LITHTHTHIIIYVAVRSRNWLTGLSGLRHSFSLSHALSVYLFFSIVFPCVSHYIILLGGFVRWPALARLFVLLLLQWCASAAVAAIQTNRFSARTLYILIIIISIPADAAAASDSSDSPSSRYIGVSRPPTVVVVRERARALRPIYALFFIIIIFLSGPKR